jgi:hypothetical protein
MVWEDYLNSFSNITSIIYTINDINREQTQISICRQPAVRDRRRIFIYNDTYTKFKCFLFARRLESEVPKRVHLIPGWRNNQFYWPNLYI